MPDASTNIATQGGAVTGNVTTGGDFAGRDLYKHIHYHTGPTPAGFLYVGVPSLPHHFLGRDELVADLVKRLCAGQTTALAADGLPGVGKTTLAVALARHPQLLAHFRDGILWAGLGRLADVASIQATWGDALGVDLRDLPHPYARTQRLTNAIGHRRLLLVLDDVWQWEAADQLRCSAPGVATLLTTRDQAIARRFAGAHQCVNVPVLEAQPAYELLVALAPEACATDPAAAQRLAALVDGLPLALELLGGYLDANRRTQARRQQALTALTDPAARLALASQRLGDPHHQAVTLQATIALSLADLPATTVAAFHALGAFAPKPARFTLPAALAVTGADEETIFTLADRNLVEMGRMRC
ncbi:MAG: NB-ARC domain-containing protein [Caldilineaceae bacterium]